MDRLKTILDKFNFIRTKKKYKKLEQQLTDAYGEIDDLNAELEDLNKEYENLKAETTILHYTLNQIRKDITNNDKFIKTINKDNKKEDDINETK